MKKLWEFHINILTSKLDFTHRLAKKCDRILVVGAILTPGKCTVSAVLRVMGMSGERSYAKYHQVLSRASWSGLTVRASENGDKGEVAI
jgi:hypothetical protein